MKKKINKKDIPGYAYGASEVVGAVTNGLAATMPYATSGKATVGTALGGMASGAASGAALGPWGAVAGAAIGGIMGAIGSGGSVDEYTGEITNPSGIAGLFGHSKGFLQRKSNRIKNSNIGRQMTEALRADYYNNSMAEYNPNTFAEGGTVGKQTEFYTSPGELYVRPQSHETVMVEPNAKPNGEDNVLNVEPEGAGGQVFSHKNKILAKIDPFGLKVKKDTTDAEYMKKIIKPNKKATDKYAQGTLDANQLTEKIAANIVEENKSNKRVGKYAGGTPYVQLGKDPLAELEKKLFEPVVNPNIENELAVRKAKAAADVKKTKWTKFSNSLSQIGQLAAPIINMAKSKEPVEKPVAHTISPTYGRTTVDNRPLLRQIGTTDAITRYNASNLGGAGQAYALQSALNTNRSLADVWSDTYNKEITLANNNAAVANRAKEFNSQVMHTADVEYAQNKAARDNMLTTGVGQLGQMIGGIGRDNKLMARDAALYRYMLPMLDFGTESKYYNLLNKYYGITA